MRANVVFADVDCVPGECASIKGRHRGFGLGDVGKLDQTEAATAASVSVQHDLCVLHLPIMAEQLPQVVAGYIVPEISDTELCVHRLLLSQYPISDYSLRKHLLQG